MNIDNMFIHTINIRDIWNDGTVLEMEHKND